MRCISNAEVLASDTATAATSQTRLSQLKDIAHHSHARHCAMRLEFATLPSNVTLLVSLCLPWWTHQGNSASIAASGGMRFSAAAHS